MVASEGEAGVQANLQRKAIQADEMFENLVDLMKDSLKIDRSISFSQVAELPPWMTRGDGISSAASTGRNGTPKRRRASARDAVGN